MAIQHQPKPLMPISSSFHPQMPGMQGVQPYHASPSHPTGLMHSPSNNNGNLDPNQTMRLEQQRAELRSAKLPHYLDVQNMHKTSVTKKVDFKLLESLPKFDGSNTPTLREWLEAILIAPST